MGQVVTQPSSIELLPGRGLREFSNPTDPAGFVGVAGIQFDVVLGNLEVLAGIPFAQAVGGASYLSNIHGGLGSDARNPAAAPTVNLPATGFNGNAPAFAGPEATGLYLPPSPLASNVKENQLYNTEKIMRSPSDAAAGANNGTIWTSTEGRRHLNFSLWISQSAVPIPGLMMYLELYRDLNAADKVAGKFGAGLGATDLRNAQLVASWAAPQALRNVNLPNFATAAPYAIPAGCNLYLLFRTNDASVGNQAAGSIWLS